jgi:hypothetical protein
LKRFFVFLIFFPFFLFSSNLEIFPLKLFFSKKSLSAKISVNIPDNWVIYSDKKSINGSPLKIKLNDKSDNISSIELNFPGSMESDGDFFYINRQKIPIKLNLKNQSLIVLNESDFLLVNYVMCNKKSGECIRNSKKIMLKFE